MNGKPVDALASFGQERLWFLYQLDPESPAYHDVFAVRLAGTLKIPLVEECINRLIARHEALRTNFLFADGRLYQAIAPQRRIELMRTPWRESLRPFDPCEGPLIRAHLEQVAEQEHLLVLTIHHLVTDGWSNQILLQEFAALYEGVELPPLPMRYAGFAAWQRERCLSDSAHLAYWKEQLAGRLTPLDLPADRPRGKVQRLTGAREAATFAADLTGRLKAFSRQERTSLFMTLLTAFQTLLYRYTGKEDIAVGSPIAGRIRTEAERLVGFLVNTLVLRTDLSGEPSFRAALARVRRVALEAYTHQETPFEQLVEALQPERDPSRTPLFEVMFQLRNVPKKEVSIPGLAATPVTLDTGTAKFDLTVEVTETPQGLWCSVEYNSDLFDAATIRRLLGHYETLLQGAMADPELPVSRLPILTEAERRQFVEWNTTGREYPQECLQDFLAARAETAPGSVAVEFDGKRLTYGELNERSNQLAHFLRGLGVGPEMLVAVIMERSLELVIALHGVLKAGGAYVPMDMAYPPERVAYMLHDADARVLLTQRRLAERLPDFSGECIYMDEGWDRFAGESTANPVTGTTPENLAYVIYTSGSTGAPKGAMNTHKGICNRLRWMQDEYQLTAGDTVLQKTPYSFDVSVWEFFWPALAGARLVVAEPEGHRDARYLIDLITREGVTVAHFVPSMLRAFLAEPGVERCRSLRHAIASGEALPWALQEEFFARLPARLHNLYGPTEAAVDVTHWTCRRDSARKVVPIGRPVANTQIHLLDRRRQQIPIGVPGELHIGGVQVGRGYHGRPELTAERFIADPFGSTGDRLYKTGDLCRRAADGTIEYLERMDSQVKLRGLRVELGEIEVALAQHAGVKSAAVTVLDDERLAAYVVAAEEARPTAASLRDFVKGFLPDYMVPAAFVFLDALPLGPSGKLDRRALPEPSSAAEPAIRPPRTELEKQVEEIWREVLKLDQIGVDADFFELGGHSLLAARVLARIRQQFQVEIKLREFFTQSTIEGLAGALAKAIPAVQGTNL